MHKVIKSAGCLLIFLTALTQSHAQVFLTIEHTDIGIDRVDDRIDLRVFDRDGGQNYAPDEVVFYVAPQLQLQIPGGQQWQFLGGNPGDPIWVLQQNQRPDALFLGFSSTEGQPVDDDTLYLCAYAVDGPGNFSMWQTIGVGEASAWWSSAFPELTRLENCYPINRGGHTHANFGFTAPGYYTVFAFAWATVEGEPVYGDGFYTFAVDSF